MLAEAALDALVNFGRLAAPAGDVLADMLSDVLAADPLATRGEHPRTDPFPALWESLYPHWPDHATRVPRQ